MSPHKEEKIAELEKVLQSRILHGSDSLKAFLRFVVLKAVEHQDDQLKEYTIATEVLGRSDNYDSRSDSVVRVQAGRLRAKLQEYYATEGKHDKVLIDLPKGHYIPAFSYADNSSEDNGITPNVLDVSALQARPFFPEPVPAKSKHLKFTISGLGILCLTLGVLAVNYAWDARRLRESTSLKQPLPSDVDSAAPLWGDFLRSPEPILIAFSNTRFRGTAETGMRLLKPLDSPGTSFGGPNNGGETSSVITEHYTGVGEVMGIYALGDFFYKAGHSIRVKRSLLLTWEDLKTSDIVVLGSPAENLLIRDLPQQQDFVFRLIKGEDDNATFGIVNTKPRPGEQNTYFAKQDGPSRSQISEDYAVISLLKGLDEKHRLILLAGITTFGTQAAAEYVANPVHVKELIASLNTSQAGESPKLPSYFQVLIKVKVNGGVPVQASYVTHHVL